MLLKANGEARTTVAALEKKVATLKVVAGIGVAAALVFFVRASKL
jgi:hypothetical protein